MKKILSVLLLVACVFFAVSCDNNGKGKGFSMEKFQTYFESSVPTKSVTKISESISSTTLKSEITVVTGALADGTKASVYQSNIQSFNDIESIKLNYINETKQNIWYCEGKGTSTTKGRTWNAEGVDFAPTADSIFINLDSSMLKNVSYDNSTETLSFEVPGANALKVIGNFIPREYDEEENDITYFPYDTKLTITAAGGRITNIKIEYTVEGYDVGDDIANMVEIGDINVVIEAAYSYHYQTISFD
jgi:hypothetical protein